MSKFKFLTALSQTEYEVLEGGCYIFLTLECLSYLIIQIIVLILCPPQYRLNSTPFATFNFTTSMQAVSQSSFMLSTEKKKKRTNFMFLLLVLLSSKRSSH